MDDILVKIERKEVKHVVLSWNNRLLYFGVFMILLFFSTCLISIITFQYGETLLSSSPPEAMSILERQAYYNESFKDYSQATGEQLLWTWIRLFKDCTYQQNGDYKYKQVDCTGAVNRFFQEYKANLTLENVASLNQRIQNLSKLGLVHKRRRYKDVRPGDLILMNFGKTNHIGVVYKCSRSIIQYMDLNLRTNGWGLSRMNWKNKKITTIAKMSYTLWVGDLIKNVGGS